MQYRQCEALETGDWGRTLRLFYHEFYGEGGWLFAQPVRIQF